MKKPKSKTTTPRASTPIKAEPTLPVEGVPSDPQSETTAEPVEPAAVAAEHSAEPLAAEPTREATPADAVEPGVETTPVPTVAKKLSALDAAAVVLASATGPMTTKQLIAAMATQGLWTSPGGKTPAATLYSALLREIIQKGESARFVKTTAGHFARRGA